MTAGIWCAVLSVVGFGASLYSRPDSEPLATPFVVHGVVYSCWVALFLAQAALLALGKVRWHRALGAGGALLLLAMIPAGLAPVLYKVAAGTKTVDEGGANLATLALGLSLAFAGLLQRMRPAVHKRLMLFATVVFTVAAADRVAAVLQIDDVRLFRKALAVVPAVALVAYDAARERRAPPLASVLFALVWFDIYYVPSDWLFETPTGARLIESIAALAFPNV